MAQPQRRNGWLELLLPKDSAFKQRDEKRKTEANGSNYARSALERECAAVTSARPNTRNHTLNKAAFNLGQLIAGGLLSESEVHDRLYSAAVACGLVKDDGHAQVEKTIASGLGAGMGKPRGAPEQDADRTAKPHRKKGKAVAAALEDNVALEFAQKHANRLRYIAASSQWMCWSGSHWENENTLTAFDQARKLCRLAGDARAKTVAAVVTLARSDRIIAATMEQWDSAAAFFNTTSTTFDLNTGLGRSPDPADYITKKAGCEIAPVGTPAPLWDAFLKRITAEDVELQKFLQRYIGYCSTGFIDEHVFAFAYGQGANGKGTFINTLAKIFGDYATVADMNTFLVTHNERHPTDVAKLRGARLVVAQETQKGRRWDEVKIKSLTGGDKLTARFMRQDFFDFTPTFKLFIAGNHKPRLSTIDEAMRRRMLVVPFTVQIPPTSAIASCPTNCGPSGKQSCAGASTDAWNGSGSDSLPRPACARRPTNISMIRTISANGSRIASIRIPASSASNSARCCSRPGRPGARRKTSSREAREPSRKPCRTGVF
jgi:P4 family phage/plasmid primase-like protien